MAGREGRLFVLLEQVIPVAGLWFWRRCLAMLLQDVKGLLLGYGPRNEVVMSKCCPIRGVEDASADAPEGSWRPSVVNEFGANSCTELSGVQSSASATKVIGKVGADLFVPHAWPGWSGSRSRSR